MVKVFTSHLTYEGEDKLNIAPPVSQETGPTLAPTRTLYGGYKRFTAEQSRNTANIRKWEAYEPLTWEQFCDSYLQLLRTRYAADKQPFLDVLHQERVVLACHCAAHTPCHRYLAVDVLEKIAQRLGLPFERGGELDPRTGRLLLPPDDPARQEITFPVVMIVAPKGKTPVGWGVVAWLRSTGESLLLEIGHVGPGQQEIADEYSRSLIRALTAQGLSLEGRADDLEATLDRLKAIALTNRLPGVWQELSDDGETLESGEFTLVRSAEKVKLLAKLTVEG